MANNTTHIEGIEFEIAGIDNSGKSLSSTIKNLEKLKATISQFNNGDVNKVKDLAKGIKELGNVGGNTKKLQKLSEVAKETNKTISNIGNVGSSKKQINNEHLQKLIQQARDFDKETQKKNAQKHLQDLIKQANEFGNAVPKAFNESTKSINELTQKSDEIKNTSKVFDLLKLAVGDKLKRVITELGSSLGLSSKTVSAFGAKFGKVGIVIAAVVTTIKLAKKAFSSLIKEVSKFSKMLFTALTYPFKNFVNSLKDSIKHLTGFLAAIKRIAIYRLIRSALKKISEGFKEGTQNAYQYALMVNDKLATSFNTISTATNYLKNSLGAMVAPLINSIAPVVDMLVDKFVDLLNIINQVLAIIGGQSTWLKAKKYPTDYMDSVAGSTRNATKELKLWLAAFDELNVIPNQKDSGGGSGSGDVVDYGNMFETQSLNNSLKGLFDNGEWEKVGKELAIKLNSITKEMDNWINKKFRPKAKKFVSNLARVLNGFVDNYNWNDLGKTIADGINAAMDIAYEFYTRFNFENFGRAIGNTINGFFKNVNWNQVGRTFASKWNALIDSIYGFVVTTNWSRIGTSISNFIMGWFRELKIEKAFDGIAKFVNGAVEAIGDFFVNTDWKYIANKITTSFNKAIANINWVKAGQTTSNVITDLMDFLTEVLRGINWEEVQKQLTNYFQSFDWKKIIASGMNLLYEAIRLKWNTFLVKFKAQHPVITSLMGNLFDDLTLGTYDFLDKEEGALSNFNNELPDYARKAENNYDPVLSMIVEDPANKVKAAFESAKQAAKQSKITKDGSEWTIDFEGNIVKTKDGRPAQDKRLSFTGDIDKTKNNLTNEQKLLPFTANLNNKKDEIKTKTLTGFTANLTTKNDNIKSKTLDGFKSNITSFKNDIKNKTLGGFRSNITSFSNNISNKKLDFTANVNKWVNNVGTLKLNAVANVSGAVNAVSGKSIQLMYASGGYPETGELFIAREAGPELVGTMNGRTAVANNDQIVKGIEAGVARGLAGAGGGTTSVNVYLDGKQIYDSVVRQNNRRVAQTGRSDLVY